jgi:hypothetical protein
MISTEEQKLDGRTLAGYAAVYGQDSREIVEHGRAFVERIASRYALHMVDHLLAHARL